ncbi:8-amino-7-oxononanoate synthase [Kushneria indalinina]|uniref:8-amino-7-oxononanoate synthase n=1 Tax=Kushneria indalinina DSM 14324 TaxID=1122140 RepID=A0A3D9DXZ7_9GAMM|nr:8-amino-7-oxononanoate synthase [Kushneria indalinina]REC95229.1 8-amino-7-oxononanoate synthase [Kushneria indalinina DSM 14324]
MPPPIEVGADKMNPFETALQHRLEQQKAAGRYRRRRSQRDAGVHTRINGRDMLTFCSNDYLGLATHPRVVKALCDGARRHGAGGGASHLVNGHQEIHDRLEMRLAQWTGRERALLFGSGYQANLGVISALMSRGGHVVHDRLNHASLLDGTLLSGARLHRFAHGDTSLAEQTLAGLAPESDRLLVSDGVFSMDGDCADVNALARLAERYDTPLMIDDAHGLGVLGQHGAGTLEAQNMPPDRVPILVGTLGKALGTQGAFVTGSHALIESLIQFARPFIYTTSLSPALASATLAALDLVQTEPERRAHLHRLIQRFRQELATLALPGITLMPSETPIQPLLVGSEQAAMALSESLYEDGILCTAIRPPTVPPGQSRLRVTLSAAHTEADLDRLLTALERCCRTVTS